MMNNQLSKNLLIFDSFTSNGFLLAQKLLSQGYTIHLYTDPSTSIISSNTNVHPNLIIWDLTQGCNNNFVDNSFFQMCDCLIVIDSIADTKLFFDESFDITNTLNIANLKEKLILQAKINHIKIVNPAIWHCDPDIVYKLITRIFDFLYTGSERRIYVNTLHFDFFLAEDSAYLDLLEKSIVNQSTEDLNMTIENSQSSIREIFSLVFEELGAEIEFCGRAEYERGVIVDYEEDVLTHSSDNTSKIRLGNTVVKINEHIFNDISTVLKGRKTKESTRKTNYDVLLKIKRLIKSKIHN